MKKETQEIVCHICMAMVITGIVTAITTAVPAVIWTGFGIAAAGTGIGALVSAFTPTETEAKTPEWEMMDSEDLKSGKFSYIYDPDEPEYPFARFIKEEYSLLLPELIPSVNKLDSKKLFMQIQYELYKLRAKGRKTQTFGQIMELLQEGEKKDGEN